MDEAQARELMCEIGRRLWQVGFAPANAGNLTIRLGDDRLLCTPTLVSKGFMSPDEMVLLSLDGQPLGPGRASSEVRMHLAVYQARPDVGGIVHVHPPVATGFAAAGLALPCDILTEVLGTLGSVPLVPVAVSGTEEVPDNLRPFLADYDAFLLANHGALTVGADLWQAFHRMEIVEHAAQVALVAHQLGGATPIPAAKAETMCVKRPPSS
ncbi:MAG: class II aldolase/adducin family protein [Armatimonadetes bacterium]|nr:class II aldolase/adducin family protein [Armatimonadota bacterium]